jgi:hypothetical protein
VSDLVARLRERQQYIEKRLLAASGNALFVVQGDADLDREAADALEAAEADRRTMALAHHEIALTLTARAEAAEARAEHLHDLIRQHRSVCAGQFGSPEARDAWLKTAAPDSAGPTGCHICEGRAGWHTQWCVRPQNDNAANRDFAQRVVQEDFTEDGTACAACGQPYKHEKGCAIYAQNRTSAK